MLLNDYLNDGANHQIQAVLAMLKYQRDIESSWNAGTSRYDAEIEVGRYENCREQGYCITLINENRHQMTIVVFEHRSSDQIHMHYFLTEQPTINTPNNEQIHHKMEINKGEFCEIFQNGAVTQCARDIFKLLTIHWEDGVKK